jgi:hypothetical protein
VAAEHLGPWEPLPVADAVSLFKSARFRWWLSGGHGLEAHLSDSWRAHEDTDIGIVRSDAAGLAEVLGGWDIHVGAAGVLTAWDGGAPDPERSQNNLWCRPTAGSPWALDVTVGDGNDDEWIFRRDPTVRRRWAEAVLLTGDGTPYLAPELQMLFKSKTIRAKDDVDAAVVLPRLERNRQDWLRGHLPADHPWQRHLVVS